MAADQVWRVVSQWTREVPTAPGWYWFRNTSYFATVVHIEARKGDGTLRMLSDEYGLSSNLPEHGEWCGPLEVPQ